MTRGILISMPWAPLLARLLQPFDMAEVALSGAVAAVLSLGILAILMKPVLHGLRPAALECDGESWLSRDLSKAR